MFGLMKSRLFATKSLEQLTQEASSDASGLKRVLGPWHLIFLGVGAIVGAGIFVITGPSRSRSPGSRGCRAWGRRSRLPSRPAP